MNVFTKLCLISMCSAGLVACGGSGGGSDASSSAQSPTTQSSTSSATTETTSTLSEAEPNSPVDELETTGSAAEIPDVNTTETVTLDIVTSEETVTMDYTPDTDLLDTSAESSNDLYVKPEFDFQQFNTVQVELSAADGEGNPLQGKLVKIYAVESDITDMEDERFHLGDLLFVGRLDSDGRVEKTLELIESIEKVVVKVMTVGIDNQALLTIDPEAMNLVHSF